MATTIEHDIIIAADPAKVWRLLADVDGWARWNPLYPMAKGPVALGKPIEIAVALPGLKPQPARPVITEIVPEQRLGYRTAGIAGLLKADRFMTITPTGPDRVTFTNGETMAGLLGPLIALLVGSKMRAGFAAMGQALKREAEAG